MKIPRPPAWLDLALIIVFVALALGQLHEWNPPLDQNERDFYLLMLMASIFVRRR